MSYGPFKLEVSNRAQRVDLDTLSEEMKTSLFTGTKFDPRNHEIFLFSVAPIELLHYQDLSWTEKRKTYQKADRVLIQIRLPATGMELLGIYPTTFNTHKQQELDLGGEVLFEFNIPKIFRFQVTSKIQNKIRSSSYGIFSSRTNHSAQWIYLKNWVKSGNPFEMEIFCKIPKDLPTDQRHILCDAQANQKGRRLNGVYNALVLL
ncbi:MAG: hypothetical protein KJ914_04730 [Gammaproteobacteria bacterium]|nr:hypothetical protein [Gammaproteobacteria bacterium]MBU1724550.1 hypothetical protein [Gammaproteobacteria bacterium]MBU2004593.1 hypothetical protein [Gammaproteobacteria bacterium]